MTIDRIKDTFDPIGPVNPARMGEPIPIAGPLGNMHDEGEDDAGDVANRNVLPNVTTRNILAWLQHANIGFNGEAFLRALCRERDELATAATDHDRRVTELLEANNREVERRRAAEAEASRWFNIAKGAER